MSVREYIGARYVPMFADPIEWDSTLVYEPLTVVQYQGGSYVSRREVPAGIELSNTDYWILWADFNAQLQHYIDIVNTFDSRIDDIEDALPIADFDSVDTIDARFDAIEAKFPISVSDIGDGAITTAKIDDGAITTAKIDDEAITTAKMDDGAITTAKMNDGAITTAKINDGAITTAKIDDEAITTAKIDDGAITTAKIDDASITEDKISSSFRNKINSAIIGNKISSTIEPIYAGDVITKGQLQSIAVDGDDIYLGFRDGTNFTPCIKRISREGNNILSTYSNASLGHANSMTYDPIRNLVLLSSGTIYALDKTLATFTTFISQPGNAECISFDHVTETLWVMSGLSADATQTLYKMEKDESDFSLFATITNITGRQDMVVYDDVMFINDTRNNCYIFEIDRDNLTLNPIDNVTFAKHDSANRWIFIEPEGMTIDSSGYFWLTYGNVSAVNNADGTTSCDGFVCNIPFNGKAIQPVYQSVIDHEVLYFNSSTQNSFASGITSIKSLLQCKWMNLSHVRELQFQSDFTDEHAGWLPDKSIHITINSDKTVHLKNTIQVIGGYIQLRILGTLVSDAIVFAATNRAVVFTLRNTGTLTINNTNTFISFGTFPAILLIMVKGTTSGTYTFGSTALTGNNTYMIGSQTGSY